MTATSGTPHDGFGPKALDLDDTTARIAAAKQTVSQLCLGEMRWTMSVPARLDEDPDLVIGLALHRAAALVARVRDLEARMQRAAAHLHAGGGIGAALRELEGAP
jgi:hypothetical protein